MTTSYYQIKVTAGNDSSVHVFDGTTWSTIAFGVEASGRYFNCIHAISPTDIWVGCHNNAHNALPAFYHYDGLTWTLYDTIDGWTNTAPKIPYYGTLRNWAIQDIWFYDSDNGYAVITDPAVAYGGQLVRWIGASNKWSYESDLNWDNVGGGGNLFCVHGIDMTHVYITGSNASSDVGAWFWDGTGNWTPRTGHALHPKNGLAGEFLPTYESTLANGIYAGAAINTLDSGVDSNPVYLFNQTNGTIYKGVSGAWTAQYTLSNANLFGSNGAVNLLHANQSNQHVWLLTQRSTDSHLFVTHYDGTSWTETDISSLGAGYTILAVTTPIACTNSFYGNNTVILGTTLDAAKKRPYFNGSTWTLTAADGGTDGYSKGSFAYDPAHTDVDTTTITTDLESKHGVQRRYFLKIDGFEPILWQDDGSGEAPSGWTRSGIVCLDPPTEHSMTFDPVEMCSELSAMSFMIRDFKGSDLKWYFSKLFAPARWDTVDHARVAVATAPNTYIAANATSLPLVYSAALPSSGTAYIGQETFTYGGKSGDTLTGVSKGLYSCVGDDNFGFTYYRPEADSGDYQMAVGTVPFSFHGRRVAFYVTTFSRAMGAWRDSDDTKLLWMGRISDAINYDPMGHVWTLSCKSIISELQDKKIATNMPRGELAGINLQGEFGRKFTVSEHYGYSQETGESAKIITHSIEIPKNIYTLETLKKEIMSQLNTTQPYLQYEGVGYKTPNSGVFFDLVKNKEEERYELKSYKVVFYEPWRLSIIPDGFCHALNALGFSADEEMAVESQPVDDPDGTVEETVRAIIKAESKPYSAYHPLSLECNNARLYLRKTEPFWIETDTGQGDGYDGSGFLLIDDAVLNSYQDEKGTAYFKYYTSTVDDYYLNIDIFDSEGIFGTPSWGYGISSFVGALDGDPIKTVSQCYVPNKYDTDNNPRGPYRMLLEILCSTGTTSYNGAYDILPLPLSAGIQNDLIDHNSFLEADKSIINSFLADRSLYIIREGTSVGEMIAREAKLFGKAVVWNDEKLRVRDIYRPAVDSWTLALTDSNTATSDEIPTLEMSNDTIVNEYECKMRFNIRDGLHAPAVVITDMDSAYSIEHRRVTLEHPGVRATSIANLTGLLDNILKNRILRYPQQMVRRSLAPYLIGKIHVGDVVSYSTDVLPDPSGTGDLSVSTYAQVLDVQWDYQRGGVGTCTLMLLTQNATQALPWAPSALINKSALYGGWDSEAYTFTLYASKYERFWIGSKEDGEAFVTGDKVLVIERCPADYLSPTTFGPLTVASTYQTDGDNILTVQPATLAGWDSHYEYVLTYADFPDVVAAQKLLGTWQADNDAGMLDNYSTRGMKWG